MFRERKVLKAFGRIDGSDNYYFDTAFNGIFKLLVEDVYGCVQSDTIDYLMVKTDKLGGKISLTVSPNPARDWIKVQLDESELSGKIMLRLLDMGGRTMLERRLSGTQELIHIGYLQEGLSTDSSNFLTSNENLI